MNRALRVNGVILFIVFILTPTLSCEELAAFIELDAPLTIPTKRLEVNLISEPTERDRPYDPTAARGSFMGLRTLRFLLGPDLGKRRVFSVTWTDGERDGYSASIPLPKPERGENGAYLFRLKNEPRFAIEVKGWSDVPRLRANFKFKAYLEGRSAADDYLEIVPLKVEGETLKGTAEFLTNATRFSIKIQALNPSNFIAENFEPREAVDINAKNLTAPKDFGGIRLIPSLITKPSRPERR